MSMIANENTSEHIAEDLEPFMAHHATSFSDWLQNTLNNTPLSSTNDTCCLNEELDIQIDTNEFELNEESSEENAKSSQLTHRIRSFADENLERIRSKRRVNDHDKYHRTKRSKTNQCHNIENHEFQKVQC